MLEVTPRKGLVVWVYSLKQIKQLRHYGTVIYVSKKMKYVYLYMDAADIEATSARLLKLRFVKKVEVSVRGDLATTYGDQISEFKRTEEDEEEKKKRGGDRARH